MWIARASQVRWWINGILVIDSASPGRGPNCPFRISSYVKRFQERKCVVRGLRGAAAATIDLTGQNLGI